ncbi:MFS transporter [Gordonia neofelifaecis]|uniref:Drug resistance efflux protein n=1 Tax=Gordonia neofelifaecis NRRL B-59395 TaxID=644548 RepID=F1YDX7_9ACTN|nr:MFS transporter [Gordonia neofelifaecis]EGD57067.1 drug resistance efflux protein [Gordonia neofelifaecis NRRL B-59395]
MPHTADRRNLATVLALLFTTGWATNHFVAMMPVLHDRNGISDAALEGAFGIYAVGLLPGLLTGGGISDRVGRKPIVLAGATGAALGNLLMLVWHTEPGVFVGRFAVGLGVGLAVSAGTAWSADLGGRRGTVLAGASLTCGFAIGPLISGLIAQFTAGAALFAPFAVTVVGSLLAVVAGFAVPNSRRATVTDQVVEESCGAPVARSLSRALATSLPMSLWVFASVTASVVIMAGRMSSFSGPWVPGVAAVLALGSGFVVQVVARRATWGPRAGVSGAMLSATGFAVVAASGSDPSPVAFLVASVLLGGGYGLCLREGLLDVETFAPTEKLGLATGIFYVGTYLGFGLPVLLRVIAPAVGINAPMIVLAALAVACAGIRAIQLRRGVLDGR